MGILKKKNMTGKSESIRIRKSGNVKINGLRNGKKHINKIERISHALYIKGSIGTMSLPLVTFVRSHIIVLKGKSLFLVYGTLHTSLGVTLF